MRDLINIIEAIDKGCPPATQSIDLNLKNRKKAIDEYMYGPLDPNAENQEYWQRIADEWNIDDTNQAKTARCGNCAAFDISPDMQDCIAKGIGSEPSSDAMETIDAGTLGYCKFLKFKCAAKRTCSAWVEGGPIKEENSNDQLPSLKKISIQLPTSSAIRTLADITSQSSISLGARG